MGEEAMKESDVQAAMDTQLKVAADGLWYDEAAFIPQQIAWSAWHDFTSWSESGGSFERPSAERVDELRANDPSLTEEMILAGIVAMRSYEEGDDAGEIAAVWKAMGAQSPVREYIAGLRAQINRLPDATRCEVSGALLPPQQPDPGDSLYEECLAVQGEPEIPVTAEMIAAGRDAAAKVGSERYISLFVLTPIYRAMAALAPKNTASKWWPAQWQEGQARIAALEGENVEFKLNNTKLLEAYSSISKKLGELQTEKRNQVGLRVGSFPGSCDESHPATNERAAAAAENNALTTQMDTLIQAGIQTYRDECTKRIAALEAAFESERNMRITMEDCLRDAQQTALRYKRDLAVLEAESAELNEEAEEHAHLIRQLRGLTVVGADLPDPPRRPDGTLAPASKPWTPPKDTGNKRRIGG